MEIPSRPTPFWDDDDGKFIGTTTYDDDKVEGTTFVYLRGRVWKEQYLVIRLLGEGWSILTFFMD